MENNTDNRKIEISQETIKYLDTLRKWSMFLAVSGFIFLGLIIVMGIIAGTFLTAFNHTGRNTLGLPDLVLMAGFVGLILINLFPIFYLFRFSVHTSNAVSNNDSAELTKAVRYLKRFFLYLGILLITLIILYVTILVITGTTEIFPKGQ
jgi:amino acid transporter